MLSPDRTAVEQARCLVQKNIHAPPSHTLSSAPTSLPCHTSAAATANIASPPVSSRGYRPRSASRGGGLGMINRKKGPSLIAFRLLSPPPLPSSSLPPSQHSPPLPTPPLREHGRGPMPGSAVGALEADTREMKGGVGAVPGRAASAGIRRHKTRGWRLTGSPWPATSVGRNEKEEKKRGREKTKGGEGGLASPCTGLFAPLHLPYACSAPHTCPRLYVAYTHGMPACRRQGELVVCEDKRAREK